MGSSRVKLGVSAPKKVRKLKNGGSFSGTVNLGAGSPTRYSDTSGRFLLTIPFDSIRSPSIEASFRRRQGLGGGKNTPSLMFGGKYTYDINKKRKPSRKKSVLKEQRLSGAELTNEDTQELYDLRRKSDIQKIADHYAMFLIGKKGK